MTYKPDQRDRSPEPPAYLDPIMVLKARRWLMTREGWEELKARREKQDWSPVQ
jgi:hypothetical protein